MNCFLENAERQEREINQRPRDLCSGTLITSQSFGRVIRCNSQFKAPRRIPWMLGLKWNRCLISNEIWFDACCKPKLTSFISHKRYGKHMFIGFFSKVMCNTFMTFLGSLIYSPTDYLNSWLLLNSLFLFFLAQKKICVVPRRKSPIIFGNTSVTYPPTLLSRCKECTPLKAEISTLGR